MTRQERAASAHPVLAWLRREALPLAVMLLLLGAARDTLANHYQVPSGSMQPTLQPGDHVVVPTACACRSPASACSTPAIRSAATWPCSIRRPTARG